MAIRVAAAAVGGVFGVVMVWSGLSDPSVLRAMLLLEDAYVYLLFVSAVGTAFVGMRVLRAVRARALLTGERVSWTAAAPERRHVLGSLMFGAGWGIANACPGPIAAQIGSGIWWSVFTVGGVGIGIAIALRGTRRDASASAPASVEPARRPLPAGE